MNSPTQRVRSIVLVSLWMISLATVLLAYAYIGTFNRWVADDYCSAASYRAYGFFGNQKYWYTIWTGRVSASFAGTLAQAFGPNLMPVLPSLVLGSSLITLGWAIRPWGERAGWAWPRTTSFLLAELILVATLSRTPSIYQSLYWMSGTVTYSPPLIVLPILVGILSRSVWSTDSSRPRRPGLIILCAAVAFVAGGFNEMYLAFQAGALSLAILFFMTRRGNLTRNVRPLLLAGLLGTVLVGIVLMLSPGNSVRVTEAAGKTQGATPRDWLSLLTGALRFARESVWRSIFTSRPTTALAFLLPALTAFHLHGQGRAANTSDVSSPSRRQFLGWLILSPLIAFTLIACYFAPVGYLSAYVRAGYSPQPRTGVAAQFLFFCFACVWGYMAGLALRGMSVLRNPKLSPYVGYGSALLAILLLLLPFSVTRRALAIGPIVKQYAATWDAVDHHIRAAKLRGQTSCTVPAFPSTGSDANGKLYFQLRLIGPDPTNWVNECVAQYYGLDSIRVE